MTRAQRLEEFRRLLLQRILVLDGAMGTMIQASKPDEAAYRGQRFRDWPSDLKGNNDLLTLTQPALIRDIHGKYLAAGADIIETNTFNSSAPSLSDYRMEGLVTELNLSAARLAREIADHYAERTGQARFVAGAIGPTSRTASLSPHVNDPAFRNITFDQLVATYSEAAAALIEGGVDLIMIETIFDTLNAKAALFAVRQVIEQAHVEVPLMISGTITDASGRTLSGQTVEAFWNSIRHAEPAVVGLNCALGAKQLRPHLEELSTIANAYISAYPNAGLPNEFGQYDETAHETAHQVDDFMKAGLVNIVGGCCGTTPEHIKCIADKAAKYPARKKPEIEPYLRLSGLEAVTLT